MSELATDNVRISTGSGRDEASYHFMTGDEARDWLDDFIKFECDLNDLVSTMMDYNRATCAASSIQDFSGFVNDISTIHGSLKDLMSRGERLEDKYGKSMFPISIKKKMKSASRGVFEGMRRTLVDKFNSVSGIDNDKWLYVDEETN